ncbi:hypothetical protein RDWZM_004118 [Blomia tropicalis]|uniref:F-box domain-containing protein n=1 Tax=Blomia tropicalis TaxID=40697 RepID=A0A9Q0MGH7_BLOTA|nr:hypothetical protein RDWZM_004118 [Blomia tropicalis]
MANDSIREPLIIYRNILIPLMRATGFELDFDESNNTRYHTRFIWRSSYVETDITSEYYGQTRKYESKVDVIGIPMGASFLILHGIIVGSLADECDDVKLKIRCAPRTKSLSISSNDSAASSSSSSSTNQRSFQIASNNNCYDGNSLDEESPDNYKERIRLQLQTDFVYKLIEMFSVKLDDLPTELKLHIMSFLPLKTIVTMSRVSTTWRELSLDEQLWRVMVQKFFPDTFERREKGQSWKALFKDEFRRKRLLDKRRAFRDVRNYPFLPALPPSPPLLPIMPPPYMPMLPPPPNFIRDLIQSNPLRSLFPRPPSLHDSFWDDSI